MKFKEALFVIVSLLIIIGLCIAVFIIKPSGINSLSVAYADGQETLKYQVNYSYKNQYVYNGSATTRSSGTSNNNYFQSGQSSYCYVKMYIYGSSSNGDGSFNSGDSLTSSTINIVVSEAFAGDQIQVTNSSGTLLYNVGANSLNMTGLEDGSYNVTFFGTGQSFMVGSRASAYYRAVCTFTFNIDTNGPEINGGSTSIVGQYTSKDFTISASDAGSGLEGLYYKAPTASDYVKCSGSSVTIPSSSTNGLYIFYAKDNLGNESIKKYVFLDTNKPTGTIKNTSGGVLNSVYTKVAFLYVAQDEESGLNCMYIKRPNSSNFEVYDGETISSNEGTYYFKSIDNAGNESEVKSITLDFSPPTIKITTNGTNVINGGMVSSSVKVEAQDDVSNIKAVYYKEPTDTEYTICSAITNFTESGKYYVYAIDNAGNSTATYSFGIDKDPPELIITNTTFSSTTDKDFLVTAKDTISSVYLYIKRPLSTEYVKCAENSIAIVNKENNGRYYFYAEDSLGNKSSIEYVNLSVDPTIPTITHSEVNESIKLSWEGDCTATLNDNPYTKDTWILVEGEYFFKLVNAANRVYETSFTIGHTYDLIETFEPSCIQDGYSLYRCNLCSDEYYENFIKANGHEYEYTVSNPTCLERGFTRAVCTVCGHSELQDYVDAKGHNYMVDEYQATCLIGGYKEYTCKDCGYVSFSDYKDPLGHDFKLCVTEATCLEDGYQITKCTRCNLELDDGETIYHTGHEMAEETIFVTCTQNGGVKHYCTKCGLYYMTDEIYSSGHSYLSEITKEATCTEDGERVYLCTKCGHKETKVIKALGHSFNVLDVSVNGEVHREYHCDRCGLEKTEIIEDNYEEVSSYVEYLFDQYQPYMVYVLSACSGVWSIVMGVAIITARRRDEKEKAMKMLKNYIIGLVVIFVVLLAAPYLAKAVAQLVA